MKTRLTKDMRESIIASVMKNTNLDVERAEIEAETKRIAAQWVRDQQPKGFYDAINGHPKEWFDTIQQVRNGACNPCNVMNSALDPLTCSGDIHLDDSVSVACSANGRYGTVCMGEDQAKKVFGALHKRAQKWAEKREKTQGELRAFLLSQKTVKGVLEAMPELKRHMPAEKVKSYPLVAASNVLSSLAKLGFDAGIGAEAAVPA